MTLLLDTHVLLWLASDSPRVPATVRTTIAAASERVVSAASAYEIALKTRLGGLTDGAGVLDGWQRLLRNLQATELPLSVAHMTRAGAMVWEHRDPFDRMLVAQAQLEGLTLITDDRTVRGFEEVSTRWS